MITVITRNTTIAKAIKEVASGEPVGEIKFERPRWVDRPARADFIITRARLSARIEHWASSLGAMVIQIPESVPYLIETACKRDVVVMGSDYQTWSEKMD